MYGELWREQLFKKYRKNVLFSLCDIYEQVWWKTQLRSSTIAKYKVRLVLQVNVLSSMNYKFICSENRLFAPRKFDIDWKWDLIEYDEFKLLICMNRNKLDYWKYYSNWNENDSFRIFNENALFWIVSFCAVAFVQAFRGWLSEIYHCF